jgi:hypothetical protein
MILGHELVEAKVLLAVQQKNLLEQDQERPADPEIIRSRDDDKIDVSLLARHAFGKFARNKHCSNEWKLPDHLCHEARDSPTVLGQPLPP